MMADTFKNFADLKAAVDPNDYSITYEKTENSEFLVLSPHGGSIEGGVSELVRAFLVDNYSIYLFEGLRATGNQELHITSSNFDEPTALRAVSEHDKTISFHGYKDTVNKHTLVGGTNGPLAKKIADDLVRQGFSAELIPVDHKFAGTNSENINNKCRTGLSVQLEISTAQRQAFFNKFTREERQYTKNDEFHKYVASIYLSMLEGV
ncbi:poly-gamma-glutamate hydrolase family protein [Bacillus subtilis]|uniref:poly-gamma-glutamate hydrolase family protein n=1 Tax=Bacillus subtilis TaxID=1423 RepID=UPI00295EC8BC|nr:poly-gamma-glutamate hydrolase family protein [Bacillus subtilis]